MNLDIPMEISFDCPPGNYAAILSEIKTKNQFTDNGMQTVIRFLFEPSVPNPNNKRILVGKNFHPVVAPGSQLRHFLVTLGGENFLEKHAGQQIDTQMLINTPAELTIVHIN